jgi:DNA-binding MarR family transcriptional regulator
VASDDDARKVVLDLSEAGVEFVLETRRRRDAWFTQRLASLSDEDRALLEKVTPVLKRLADE